MANPADGAASRRPSPLGLVWSRLRRKPVDAALEVDTIAAVAEQLAVLLAAGVPAPAAWGHVGDRPEGADGAGPGPHPGTRVTHLTYRVRSTRRLG